MESHGFLKAQNSTNPNFMPRYTCSFIGHNPIIPLFRKNFCSHFFLHFYTEHRNLPLNTFLKPTEGRQGLNEVCNNCNIRGGGGGGGLAATFDLAAFRKGMIASVKKSVNHSKTVRSMREMRRIHARFMLFCPWRLDGGKRSRV